MTQELSWELPLQRLAAIGGVSGPELAAVWSRDRDTYETILLGKLLLSGLAANLVSAISAAGTTGAKLLVRMADDHVELGSTAPVSLDHGLSNCRRAELRREIAMSVGQQLDAASTSRLWHAGYLRLGSWKCEDVERSLQIGEELSPNLLDRVKGWFLEGLAQQVTHLMTGVGWLCNLHVALLPCVEVKASTVLLSVLSSANSSLKCLRAAAPLANRPVAWLDGDQYEDGLAALLCTRIFDWAFRRVEVDRPDVILRLRWRMGSSRLLWDFLAVDGRPPLEDPDDVSRDFAVNHVLRMLHAAAAVKTDEGDAQAQVPEEDDVDLERAPQAAEGASTAGLRREGNKKRRARRKQRQSEFGDRASEEEPEHHVGDESEAARREWGRLSVRMMLEMGWRAETGEVDARSWST